MSIQLHIASGPEDDQAASIELRIASGPEDDQAVRRLAALDDARPLAEETLLALVEGEPVAALALGDGRVVANPFVPTAAVVAVLRLRAAQLGRSGRPDRARRLALPRLAL